MKLFNSSDKFLASHIFLYKIWCYMMPGRFHTHSIFKGAQVHSFWRYFNYKFSNFEGSTGSTGKMSWGPHWVFRVAVFQTTVPTRIKTLVQRALHTNSLNHLPKCHIYASVEWVSIGSGNGLLPIAAQPLSEPILTYCQLDLRNKLLWNSIQNTKLFINENALENGVCEMAAILLRRWVNN